MNADAIAPPVNLTERDEVIDFLIASFEKDPRYGWDGSECVYRTSTGVGCAFGRLMPDALYDGLVNDSTGGTIGSRCEGSVASEAVRTIVYCTGNDESPWAYVRKHEVAVRGSFIDQAQAIHDSHASLGEPWEKMIEAYRSWRKHGYPPLSIEAPSMGLIVSRAWENQTP